MASARVPAVQTSVVALAFHVRFEHEMIMADRCQAWPLGSPLRKWRHMLFSVVLIFGIPARRSLLSSSDSRFSWRASLLDNLIGK